jgi:hypothetical protein
MDIHDKLKQIRDEEIAKNPPPYHIEKSIPSHLPEFHKLEATDRKVYYKKEMLVYKQKICKRIRQRFAELGIELNIDIENADDFTALYEEK